MNNGLNRRGFILGSASLAFVPRAFSGETPNLRFGVIADIHNNRSKWSRRPDGTFVHAKTKRALEYFRDAKVDAVLCCGDLADFGLKDELQMVADTWFSVFPDNRRPDGAPVVNLLHYGDHDMSHDIYKRIKDPKDYFHETWDDYENQLLWKDRKAAWEKCFKEPWTPIVHKNVKGYDFVLCHFTHGEPDNKWGNNTPGAEDFMAKLQLPKDKPFFYSQHRVYRGTAGQGKMWGQDDGRSTKLLSQYPNAIAFCGHAHSGGQRENNLWQGAFTALEVPSLDYLGGVAYAPFHENGTPDKDRKTPLQMPMYPFWQSEQGYLVDVFDDRVVVNRMDVSRGEPVAPAWVIPVPHGAASPMSDEKRMAAEIAPAFPADAKISVKEAKGKDRAGTPTEQVTFSFPPARSTATTPRAFDYVVRVTGKDGAKVERRVLSLQCARPESMDTKPVTCVFAKAELPAAPYEVAVSPSAFYGREGEAIRMKGVN